jgi:uncharacterized membrane protein YtjA (UPF0391 family)
MTITRRIEDAVLGVCISGDLDSRCGLRLWGIAAGAAGIAKLLFGLFLIIFIALLIAGLAAGRAITR